MIFNKYHNYHELNDLSNEELEKIIIRDTDLYYDIANQEAIAALFLLYKRLQNSISMAKELKKPDRSVQSTVEEKFVVQHQLGGR